MRATPPECHIQHLTGRPGPGRHSKTVTNNQSKSSLSLAWDISEDGLIFGEVDQSGADGSENRLGTVGLV